MSIIDIIEPLSLRLAGYKVFANYQSRAWHFWDIFVELVYISIIIALGFWNIWGVLVCYINCAGQLWSRYLMTDMENVKNITQVKTKMFLKARKLRQMQNAKKPQQKWCDTWENVTLCNFYMGQLFPEYLYTV